MSLIDRVRHAAGAVVDPELHRTLSELEMIGAVTDTPDGIVVEVRLTIIGCPAARRIEQEVRLAVEAVSDRPVQVTMSTMTAVERERLIARLRVGRPAGQHPFGPESFTRVFLVSSGKGGVGKSTVTANLAVGLAQRGLAVGLIDADVHGFSIPGILGIEGATPTRIDALMIPPEAHGVKVISMGMFLGQTRTAVAWRGPLLHRAVSQFLTDVYFGDLDVLLVDMPPGTGDVAISLGQLLPTAEVIVVTTPQPAAAEVAARSGLVAQNTGLALAGVIENMAPLRLSDGSVLDLFGSGGGAQVAERLATAATPVELLGSIPLSLALRRGGDDGQPLILAHPEDDAARELQRIVERLSTRRTSIVGRPLPVHPG